VENGEVSLIVDSVELENREIELPDVSSNVHGFGRELFSTIRANVGSAENGATIFDLVGEERA
jgi:phosphogluconate dehydratase